MTPVQQLRMYIDEINALYTRKEKLPLLKKMLNFLLRKECASICENERFMITMTDRFIEWLTIPQTASFIKPFVDKYRQTLIHHRYDELCRVLYQARQKNQRARRARQRARQRAKKRTAILVDLAALEKAIFSGDPKEIAYHLTMLKGSLGVQSTPQNVN